MPLPIPTTIVNGLNVAGHCAYWRDHDQLLLADSGYGTIFAVNVHTHAKTALGSGYSAPHDIALSKDGLYAYVLEAAATGNLLRVPLSNLNRAAATSIATQLGCHGQIGLDEAHGYAYIVGSTTTEGRDLLRVNISTGRVYTVARGVGSTRGVLVSSDGRFVYVSKDSGEIVRYDLSAGKNTIVSSGLKGPRYMVWSDAGESVIVFVQNGPPGMVMRLDLTTPEPSLAQLAGPTADSPYSLAMPSPDHLLIACHGSVGEVYLTSAVYGAAGPILLGIGFVPADAKHLPKGYADTTMDSAYFFQVKDAPFGGTLPLMINHDRARNMQARFYKVLIGTDGQKPVESNQPYSDYRWNAVLNQFDLVTQVPVNGFYKLHEAGEIWLNYWLGALLETSGLPNDLATISIDLFGSQDPASKIGTVKDPGRSATLMIDNTLPVVSIDQILHDGSTVGTCAIVNSGSTNFSFTITAQAQRHLAGWRLVAYWGDNASNKVAWDDYSNHISSSRLWRGVDHVTVPPAPGWNASVSGDQTSTRCAHTFWLSAWDRIINGWGYIHGWANYQKSITIML